MEEPFTISADEQRDKAIRFSNRLPVFDCPRDFLHNRFVYTVISSRAHGLSVGINMNPDKRCNFDCVYCEVNRLIPALETNLDVNVMAAELDTTLTRVLQGKLRVQLPYQSVPDKFLELRHVVLSGDGEPSLASNFDEVVKAVIHIRALGKFSFFKVVLVTNASGLDLPQVQAGLARFTKSDEVWAKLDAGTQKYWKKIARPKNITLQKILGNILGLARQRPVVIQSLFPVVNNQVPPGAEIEAYAQRLKDLTDAGAQISLVQIYSTTRPMFHPNCGHLPLKGLSLIAQAVRQIAGLRAEVF